MRPSLASRAALLSMILVVCGFGTSAASAQTALTEHTVTLDDASAPPTASLDSVAWLAGRWVGSGLGATAEEIWLPPAGGAMPGVFRLVRDGAVELYELVTLVEEEGSLTLRLKHFDADLVGWEEKGESVSFPLVHRDQSTLWFDGLTIRRDGPDHMRIWVALGSGGSEVREELFEYRRAGQPPSGR